MLKRNLLASYATQAYVSLIGLALMPFFFRHMGAEAFALIGIFWFLQSALQLLDLGLTPTVSRQMSRYRAGAISGEQAASALSGAACLFAGFSLLFIAAFAIGKHWIAGRWLGTSALPADEVAWCLLAMAIAASARWMTGLYRAAMIGLELQSLVNSIAVAGATLRFVGVVPVILFWSPTPLAFFTYQVLVGLLEWLATRWAFRGRAHGLPKVGIVAPRHLVGLAPTAGAMAFLSGAWIFHTQVDKLILSKLLALVDYGHYTLAAMVAGGVLMLVPPLNQVLQPRLTILVEQGDEAALLNLYSLSTQWVTALFGAFGITIAMFATPVLLVWTGNASAAQSAGPTLFWYGLSNAVAGLLVLPFALQFAHGQLRFQVVGAALFALLLLPTMGILASRLGAPGAGMALFAVNLVYLLCWVPIAHRRLLRQAARVWMVKDILPAAAAISGLVFVASRASQAIEGRWPLGIIIAGVFAAALFAGLMAGSGSRASLLAIIRDSR